MRATNVAIAVALALAGCDRPRAILVCHNANCVEPADPERDDTIDALRESLALEGDDGLPVIDGVEVDTFWRGADNVCLYAHDLDRDQTPALEPALVLAEYFTRPGPISHDEAAPFQIFLELKSHVSVDKLDRHSPEQADMHAACAWQLYDTIAAAAVASSRQVVVQFSAFNPDLLRAVIARTPPVLAIPIRYGAIQGVPKPLDNQTFPLDDYADIPLNVVEFHVHWILDAQYEAVRSQRIPLAVFMFSATSETFAVIEQYEPEFVVTSEARLLRRWLDR
jgi:hypothetical protein